MNKEYIKELVTQSIMQTEHNPREIIITEDDITLVREHFKKEQDEIDKINNEKNWIHPV